MTAIEAETPEHIGWLQVHNHAETTVACCVSDLDFFARFCHCHGIEDPREVTSELLQAWAGEFEVERSQKRARSPIGTYRSFAPFPLRTTTVPRSKPAIGSGISKSSAGLIANRSDRRSQVKNA